MTEHTKEPWRVATEGPNLAATRWRDAVLIEAPMSGQAVPDLVCELYRPGDANARRIVACVNALAGISDAVLAVVAEMPNRKHAIYVLIGALTVLSQRD